MANSRVKVLEREEFDVELREMTQHLTSVFELGHIRVFANLPEVAKAWLRFIGALYRTGTLSRRLVELVRLRIAKHNQCPHCMATRFEDAQEEGLTEELVCSLEDLSLPPEITDAERVALEYADLMATTHRSIDDQLFDRMREHFTDEEIIELGINIATFVGFGRLGATWRVVDDMPPEYEELEDAELRFGMPVVVVPTHD